MAEKRVLRQEYGLGAFHRHFRLGDGIDTGGVQADYRGGVLQIRLPKSAKLQSRRIPIAA